MTMTKQELKDEPIRESVRDAWKRLETAMNDIRDHIAGEEEILDNADAALYNRKHFSMAVTTLVSLLEDFITDFDENVDEDEDEDEE